MIRPRFSHLPRFRNSLAFKVIFWAVFLSLGVVWMTESALYAKISEGIRKVKIESSIAESQSAVFNAQYRIILSEGSTEKTIQQIINDVVVNSTTMIGSSANGREVVLLRSSAKSAKSVNYERTSNLVSVTSIPNSLRAIVRKSKKPEWATTTITFMDGQSIPGLAVGQNIIIPNSGNYEMYLVFSLVNQGQTLDLVKNSLIFAGLILILLIGLVMWIVVRQTIKPVQEAAKIAEQFTAGDLSQRMKVTSKDEVARLGIAFNEMALSLERQISKLEGLSRVQQRFVSDVSHELRTPLTTLRMASEVIHASRADFDPVIARSAELLVAQLDRFERLLEDLLEVSRFDADVAILESVEFDLVTLVDRCVLDLTLLATEKSVVIERSHRNDVVMVQADIRRVERILRNLISNGIVHSQSHLIRINITQSQSAVAVGVRDYGIGLDEEDAFRVFDRFWRGDPSRARVRGGTGLGLSIALEDARLHNGELEAWGRPGLGSHFVLTLPKRPGELIESRLIKLQPEDYLSTI
ncbi:unannotated protein [freshwater metagenome]|uniref:Sensor histidine kinase MtrB n=2 Tax=freshwater metagenome TaxID=449393 RepID=A0A6J6PCL9_9ZZZZ